MAKITLSLAPYTISIKEELILHLYCQTGVVDIVSVGLNLKINAKPLITSLPLVYAAVPSELINNYLILASSE